MTKCETNRPLVDERSYDLAEHFLDGADAAYTPDDLWSLAAVIQTAVEDWFEGRPSRECAGQ